MKNYLLVMALLVGSIGTTFCQPTAMDGQLPRYWFYRWRLNQNFVIVGDGPGKSMVANRRGIADITWGDGTIWHGRYLAMLATEYKLLENNERWEDLEHNKTELYYAIKALERLDDVSNSFYAVPGTGGANGLGGTPLPNRVDGFFVRDDVPADLLTNDQWNAYYAAWQFPNNVPASMHLLNDYRTLPANSTPVWKVHSGYQTHTNPAPVGTTNTDQANCGVYPLPKEVLHFDGDCDNDGLDGNRGMMLYDMSKDQTINLMMGAVLITQCVPNTSQSVQLNDGTTIAYNFVENIKRLMTNILYYTALSDIDNPGINDWTIKTPHGLAVDLGSTSGLMERNTMKTIWKDYLFTTNNDVRPGETFETHFTPVLLNDPLWNSRVTFLCPDDIEEGTCTRDNAAMTYILVALSNKGGLTQFQIENAVNSGSGAWKWQGFYGLLHAYLHGSSFTSSALSDAQQMLAEAPCWGPYNTANGFDIHVDVNGLFSTGTVLYGTNYDHFGDLVVPGSNLQQYKNVMGSNGWNSEFRFYAPPEFVFTDAHNIDNQSNTSATPPGVTEDYTVHFPFEKHVGLFNGLDYMILNNLYYLNSEQPLPKFENLVDRVVDEPIVGGNTYMAFNSLHFETDLSDAPPNLVARAGEEIVFQDGFTFTNTTGEFYIDPFYCEDGQEGSYKNGTDTTIHPQVLTAPSYGFNQPFQLVSHKDEARLHQLEATANNEAPPAFVALYPNPTNNSVNMVGTITQYQHLQITDIMGKVLVEFKSNIPTSLDLSEYSNGVYLFIFSNNNTREVIRLVKN